MMCHFESISEVKPRRLLNVLSDLSHVRVEQETSISLTQCFYFIDQNQLRWIHPLKCPLCGKEMTRMVAPVVNSSPEGRSDVQEVLHYCEKHGVMNKSSDLKEQVDQIIEKV